MKNWKPLLLIAGVLMMGLCTPHPSAAREPEVAGTRFQAIYEHKDARLELKGASLLRYLTFIKAYTGAFYLPPTTDGVRALEDVPKRLELEYRLAIAAEDFARATTVSIRKNVDAQRFRQLDPRIRQLNAMYRSVVAGDRYALTYVPGHGTELSLNGVPLGVVPGADFAAAVFSIWIGPEPIDTVFRNELLGLK
ncbi:MAG: chalcone isomerase family protein [Thermodesulfobacteriota bacterium]